MSTRFASFSIRSAAAALTVLVIVSPLSATPPVVHYNLSALIAPSCNITVTGENNGTERVDVLSIKSTDRAGATQTFSFGNASPQYLIPLSLAPNAHASFPAVANAACLGDVQYTVHLRKGRFNKDVVFPSAAAFTTNKHFDMGDTSKYF